MGPVRKQNFTSPVRSSGYHDSVLSSGISSPGVLSTLEIPLEYLNFAGFSLKWGQHFLLPLYNWISQSTTVSSRDTLVNITPELVAQLQLWKSFVPVNRQ